MELCNHKPIVTIGDNILCKKFTIDVRQIFSVTTTSKKTEYATNSESLVIAVPQGNIYIECSNKESAQQFADELSSYWQYFVNFNWNNV